MTRKEIIRALEEIADLLEFNSENVFKVNAFRNGANSIRRFEGDFELLVEEKKLNSVKGVGTALQSVIHDLYRKGTSSLLLELKKELPEGIHELFKIKGIGPKKVKQLFSELNISSIADLENGCINNRLITIKGFTQKTTENILAEIEKYKENQKYLLLSDALKIVDNIKHKLNDVSFDAFEVTGEVRRRREIVSKIEFLTGGDFEKISSTIKNVFNNVNITERTISVADFQIPVIFHYSIENDFACNLLITTGSREFLEFYKIDEFSSSEKSEHEIFRKMKISYHAPVLREKEFIESMSRVPDEKELIQISDLKGFLHFHTNYSDGMNSILEMVLSAKEFGYNFFAVCDHSKSAFYANGLSEERILLQNKELTKVSSENSLNILQGIEVDILQSGELDYDLDFIENFDFVVASVHSRFNMSEIDMTNRIIKAIEHPKTNVLGHPTGRLLLSRDSYAININKIIDACSQNNVAIEINSNPRRLDLDWRNIYYAREKGCKFSINQDAHSIEDIQNIKFGVWIAQKGGVTPSEVINCYNFEMINKFIKDKK